MPTPRLFALVAALLLPIAFAATLPGCDEEPSPKKKTAKAKPKTDLLPKDREIIGRKTTDVKDAEKEIASGKAVAVAPRAVTGKDPITVSGNAYVSIIGRASMLQIEHAVNIYNAANDGYPKDYAEFYENIIKANNIALPKLPVWQEYGYDVKTHSLILLEYPDRKAQVDREYDEKAGRKPR